MSTRRSGGEDPRKLAAARLRRIVPFFLGLAIILVITLVWTAPRSQRGGVPTPAKNQNITANTADETPKTPDTKPASAEKTPPPVQEVAATETPAPVTVNADIKGLRMRQWPAPQAEKPLAVLGGLEQPDLHKMQIEFTRVGAGIVSLPTTDIWSTARASRQAQQWFAAKAAGDTKGVEPPPDDQRYILAAETQIPIGGSLHTIPLLAARSLTINGTELALLGDGVSAALIWKETGPGQFVAEVLNEGDQVVARVTRHWSLDQWDITLDQQVVNLTNSDMTIRWTQYGPPNLNPDRSRYMDRRRFRFGYLLGQEQDPNRLAGVIADGALVVELSEVTSESDSYVLWPSEIAKQEGLELSWFASTNRYFGMAIHPLLGPEGQGDVAFANTVGEITRFSSKLDDRPIVLTGLAWPNSSSPAATLKAGATKSLSMGVYAGPLEQSILANEQPYKALNMQGLILYQMSSFCAICTFQWLAHLLLAVLAFFDHWVVFDWGVAIILLVLCVRGLLHPITRKSQMGMQKFGRQMQKLKPEMDRLRKKCGDDRKKMQEEQMRLFREHGVNPLQMLGCLPMFLQMPVWIALYAALYFSFDLRQQPAFWGVFQEIGGWPFLADLASPDHFFWEAPEPFQFLLWNVTGVNLLPILMGVIFYFQQKYMTPATSMSPEQETQQKIMRVMMVVLFPLMLYSAPSGLTLYILTSSAIGIMESRHIRKQVDAMDFDTPVNRQSMPQRSSKSSKDPQARAYAKMMQRRQQQKNQGPQNRYKKRK
ncbi:MAG: membrane protein insertase YidC [Phycisphaerales bacterium]|nr:membrane protein insertase YidC [Phycisphaerales bacterium]